MSSDKERLPQVLHAIIEIFRSVDDPRAATALASPLIQMVLDLGGSAQELGVPRVGHHVASSRWLYYAGDIGIATATHPDREVISVHDHGTWELMAPFNGRVDYTAYRQTDLDAPEGFASLAVTDKRILQPRDIEIVDLPPGDIHGWEVLDPNTAILVIIGPNLGARRRYFDPQAGTYEERTTKAARLDSPNGI
jgi:predicted metal-dependent enzyme (double-stranded beta helix superfamily)